VSAQDALDGTEHGLDPRVRTVWAVGASLPWLVVGLGGAVALAVVGSGALAAIAAVVGVVGALGSVAWAGAAWRRWRWSAWDDALELRHGVVERRASLVPYARIQQIDVERGPLEQALGLATLVLRTAAATSDAELPGIPADRADALRRHLLARAGLDDAV
jgi:membrane protein YdbS with pleckstrin-like domain